MGRKLVKALWAFYVYDKATNGIVTENGNSRDFSYYPVLTTDRELKEWASDSGLS